MRRLVNENVNVFDLSPFVSAVGWFDSFGDWKSEEKSLLRAVRGCKTNAPAELQWEGGTTGRRFVTAPHRAVGVFQRNKWIDRYVSSPGKDRRDRT